VKTDEAKDEENQRKGGREGHFKVMAKSRPTCLLVMLGPTTEIIEKKKLESLGGMTKYECD